MKDYLLFLKQSTRYHPKIDQRLLKQNISYCCIRQFKYSFLKFSYVASLLGI